MRKDRYGNSGRKGEKILKSRPTWRKTSQVKKLKILMTIVMIVLVISIAAAGVIAWVTVDPLGIWEEQTSSMVESSSMPESQPPQEEEDINISEFDLIVVNNDSPIPSGFSLEVVEVEGVPVAKRIEEDLEQLLSDAKKEGLSLELVSGYVAAEEQESLYQKKVEELENSGMSKVRAENAALESVERGGCSELQTGYTVTFGAGTATEGSSFETTAEYKWLIANSLEYGFVLRYPENKTEETEKDYDPTTFRYVGQENAQRMRQLGMCLEEYAQYMAQQQKNN